MVHKTLRARLEEAAYKYSSVIGNAQLQEKIQEAVGILSNRPTRWTKRQVQYNSKQREIYRMIENGLSNGSITEEEAWGAHESLSGINRELSNYSYLQNRVVDREKVHRRMRINEARTERIKNSIDDYVSNYIPNLTDVSTSYNANSVSTPRLRQTTRLKKAAFLLRKTLVYTAITAVLAASGIGIKYFSNKRTLSKSIESKIVESNMSVYEENTNEPNKEAPYRPQDEYLQKVIAKEIKNSEKKDLNTSFKDPNQNSSKFDLLVEEANKNLIYNINSGLKLEQGLLPYQQDTDHDLVRATYFPPTAEGTWQVVFAKDVKVQALEEGRPEPDKYRINPCPVGDKIGAVFSGLYKSTVSNVFNVVSGIFGGQENDLGRGINDLDDKIFTPIFDFIAAIPGNLQDIIFVPTQGMSNPHFIHHIPVIGYILPRDVTDKRICGVYEVNGVEDKDVVLRERQDNLWVNGLVVGKTAAGVYMLVDAISPCGEGGDGGYVVRPPMSHPGVNGVPIGPHGGLK